MGSFCAPCLPAAPILPTFGYLPPPLPLRYGGFSLGGR